MGNASCTTPQKQVAVAESSFDQPSSAPPARGKYGTDLSAVAAIVVSCASFDTVMQSVVLLSGIVIINVTRHGE